jgi:segregation and condensation protein A
MDTEQLPAQQELPLARVHGERLTRLPEDLYIPPDALEVFLDAFEGPLDFLLWLIRRQNLDILDIPVAEVAAQYMAYVDLMRDLRLELAADYLVMAAVLTEIKSRMLLPRPAGDTEEDDPGLVREIIAGGCEQAREQARETLDEVRQVMGLGYR